MFRLQGVSGCKRLAAAFIAGAATFVAMPASALTVTLSGTSTNTCSYTNITVTPAGDVTVNCSGGSPQPGTVAFSAATSGSVETGGAANVTVLRSGGASGVATATISSADANCSVTNGNVSWGDGDAAAKSVAITGGSTANTTCTLNLGSVTGATLGSQATTTLSVVGPNPGSLGFAAVSYTFFTGVTGNNVVVNRTGGTSGAASATVSASGAGCSLAAGSTATVSWNSGEGGGKNVSVNANSSPGTCTLTLAAPVGAALGSQATTTVNVVAPAASTCQGGTEDTFNGEGQWKQPVLASTQILTMPLVNPLPAGVVGGLITLSQTANTPSPLLIELAISQTKCDFTWGQNTQVYEGGGERYTPCYASTTNPSGADIRWHTENLHYRYCRARPSEGPWYFNMRMTFSQSCPFGCAISVQWNRP